MACRKCRNKRCKCDTPDLQVVTPPCTPPCGPKFQCYETIDWNCVKVPYGVLLGEDPPYTTSPGISLASLYQQQMLYDNPLTKNCIVKGNSSRATEWLYASFTGSQILVQWQLVNNTDLATGWIVDSYTVNVFDVASSTINSFSVSSTQNSILISPVGAMSFASGNSFDINVVTSAKNTTTNIFSYCQSITIRITIP